MQSNRGGGQCVCLLVQIVRQDRTMEEIVFPVPNICEFLTSESKLRVYYTTERDEQGSKINDFFLRAEDLFNEMNWQKKLRGEIKMQDMPHTRGCSDQDFWGQTRSWEAVPARCQPADKLIKGVEQEVDASQWIVCHLLLF